MLKVKILTVGKTKESWLQDALSEYKKRLQNIIRIDLDCLRDNNQLIAQIEKQSGVILLDPEGNMFDSESFSHFFYKKMVSFGSQITFVIGGAEGLPQGLRQKHPMISLSKMTFTHQITRLILVEQIYRAHEIDKGSGYHK